MRGSARQQHIDLCVYKAARNVQKATQLTELGFEYVAGEYDEGGKLFKKKKLLYLGFQN